MTLVIISNEPLQNIKENVTSTFEKIKNKNLNHNDNNDVEFINESKFMFMNSISDLDELKLYWNVKSYHDNYISSPLSYISHLLGNEDENSIYNHLLNIGYVKSLSTGLSYSNHKFGVFSMNIKLTELGFNNY
jgi:secreted Zn-dependent insulinase-like peptidase